MNQTINYDKYISQIITIQKYVRAFLKRKCILIPQSYYQTKAWRKTRSWYKGGKSNECEKYQIALIEKITKTTLNKTHTRINMETYEITSTSRPMKNDDGYEYTENFDGLLIKGTNKYYYNLKFVCDAGGAQTRTLREVYHFIKCQMEYLIKFDANANANANANTYFINILDGDECFHNMDKFLYLLNKEQYKHIQKYVFIGSLYDFQKKSASLIV
jgi:hypothetical protein